MGPPLGESRVRTQGRRQVGDRGEAARGERCTQEQDRTAVGGGGLSKADHLLHLFTKRQPDLDAFSPGLGQLLSLE